MSQSVSKSGKNKENSMDTENEAVANYAQSNHAFEKDLEEVVAETPTKRKIMDDLESNVTSGSYQALPKRAKKWNASNFKVTKTSKTELDERTEEGKYQRKVEEMAKRREKCTEICFKSYSDADTFKENMQVKT